MPRHPLALSSPPSLLLAPVLALLAGLTPVRAEQVVFSEVMYNPAGPKPEFIELWNISHTPLDMAQWRFSQGVDFTFPDFAAGSPQAHILQAQERIVVSALGEAATRAAYPSLPATVRVFGPWTGALANAGEEVVLEDKNGVLVCALDYRNGGNWPKAADGTGHSLVLRNENNEIDSFRNWRASRYAGGTPGFTEFGAVTPFPGGSPEVGVGASAVMFDYGTTWKWNLPASDPGSSWRAPGFDDAGWSSGPGLLGFENAAVPAPGMQTPVGGANQSMVYLFRKTFTFAGSPTGATVAIDQVIDDGVVYYLNGQLLGAVGHTPGAWDSGASRTVGDAAEEANAVTGPATGLVNGQNVLAAEVHQTNISSSDMVFGARLKIGTQPGLVINEVKPGVAGEGFVEFYNTTGTPVSLQDHYLSDTPGNLTKHRITTGLTVPANGYATVGFAESGLAMAATTVVYLTAPDGATALNAISAAIPSDGRSLGRNPAGGTSWFLFALPTPGAANGSSGESTFALRLSEAHFNAAGQVDWVELENTDSTAAATDGLFLASRTDFTDKIPLTGAVPGRGFASWDCAFPADADGDLTLWLVDGGGTVLGVAELRRVTGLDSLQAVWPPSVAVKPGWENVPERPWWNASPADTRNAANAPLLPTDIVINEIMPDPPSDHQNGEFIELHNRGAGAVSLTGWKLRGGVEFDFAPGTLIPAGGHLVVGRDPAHLGSVYAGATVVGPWSGRLGNRGDLVRLLDSVGNLADEVDYAVGGDWPALAAAQGSSLELLHPSMDNSRPSAWRASDETAKTSWQTFTITGPWSQLNTIGGTADHKELHLFLVGDGHIALRNMNLSASTAPGVNLLPGGGASLSTNGTAVSGWLCQGTHAASRAENGELRLIADGHGDNRPNRAEIDVSGLTQGRTYTLTFEARWISGKNRLVVQTWDHSFGAPLLVPVPDALGSAGTVNSRLAAAPLPQVDSILHSPAVPKPTDVVRVTARVASVTPLTAIEVVHRTDDINNAGAWTGTPMVDDGTGGDAAAGDGLFTASINSHQTNGRIVQFYVRATAAGGTGVAPRGGESLPALWIVDNRSLDDRLRRQRFVVSEYDRDIFNTGGDAPSAKYGYRYPRLSNHYVNATFIHNETEVYYNAEIRKSGSPWTRSGGGDLTRGKWKLPRDRFFRGREKSTYDNDAEGGSRHHNRITRYWLYVLGHPVNENEYIYHVVNGDGLAIREDTEPVDGEMVARVYPDGGNGQLFRSDDEWWFADDWNRNQRNADWSYKGTAATLRYHTEWMARSREVEYDYGTLIDLFRTVTNNPNYPAATYREVVNRMLEPDLVPMMAAVRGYIQDWDSLTLDRGKNGFFYRRPTDGKFHFLHWDSDLAFGDAGGSVVGGLTGWGNYISQPWARRTLNYYLNEMLRLTTGDRAGRTLAWLSAEEVASGAWSVNTAFYQGWFSGRAGRIRQEINATIGTGGAGNSETAPFAVTTPTGTTAAATLTLTGTAPAAAYRVTVDGQPDGAVTWSNQRTWTISGLVLREGLNTFTLRLEDALGAPVGTPLTYNYTKTGNAAPVMRLAADPGSWNVGLGQSLQLDAGQSVDPEGGALEFVWSHLPTAGAVVSAPSPSVRSAVFRTPGIYSFSVSGSDPASQQGTIVREATVFNASDFNSFGTPLLAAAWTPQALELRDSYSPAAWYSLEDVPGQLLLQVRDQAAQPLSHAAPTFPALWRDLPAAADAVVMTDFTYDSKRTGASFTGLVLDTLEDGAPVRYAFGVEGGTTWRIKRSTGGAFVNQGTAAPFTGTGATLRIRRGGNSLNFERRVDDVWSAVGTQSLPAGATLVRGGLFASTTTAENVRFAFDYALVVDPTNTNSQLNNLRITELMYEPKAPDTAEWIELQNAGAGPVSLLGVRFAQGTPFDALALPDVTVPAGERVVVTGNLAAFRARYGNGAQVVAEWSGGALNNAGESIVLLDADGNAIHDFAYDDADPWPVTPKGGGPSLEVISTDGDYSSGLNWRASGAAGGSPGTDGAVDPDADTDGDGLTDAAEALFGTNPADPNSTAALTVVGPTQFSFPSVAGNTYELQASADLAEDTWSTVATITAVGPVSTISDPTDGTPPVRFYRVRAVGP
jgi:hypothetical protein